MKLTRIGEFELIDQIRQIIPGESPHVVLGIGDDAAVLRTQEDRLILFTIDAMVEGIHFNLEYTPLESLGWKALAINISDIVAMGGLPKFGVVSLSLPVDWTVEDVKSLYKGMNRCSKAYECMLVGGDTTRSGDRCCLSVSIIGEVEEEKVMTRKGAQVGDLLCVTGEIGMSRVGLEVLESKAGKSRFVNAIHRFLEPRVKLLEVQELLETFHVTSMIDVSDGLASEIGHICKQSRLGCLIREDEIPVAGEVLLWAELRGVSKSKYLFESGEEYEFLFTLDKVSFEQWKADKPEEKDLKFSIFGEMVERDKGILVQRAGETNPLYSNGWDHFNQ